MKTSLLLLLGLALSALPARAAAPMIAQWDFNDPSTLQPSQGSGSLQPIGGVTVSNLLGTATDPGKPNGALSLKVFPVQGQGARSAGIELTVDTRGWQDLSLQFEVRASGTACRRLQVLAAPTGAELQEAGSLVISRDSVFTNWVADWSTRSDLNDAKSITIRLVADAEGAEFIGVKPKPDGSNSYGTSGTWRFDLLTLTGKRVESAPADVTVALRVVEDMVELSWPSNTPGPITIWRAPTPSGPWAPSATGLSENFYAEGIETGLAFFRITSP